MWKVALTLRLSFIASVFFYSHLSIWVTAKQRKLAESQKVFCDPNNRPDQSTCTNDYQPLCAHYSENCPQEICGKISINPCYACSDPSVIYHTPGYCDPELQPKFCNRIYCDLNYNPEDFQQYKPVCAKLGDCNGDNCQASFDNACTACLSGFYEWYKPGVCEKDRALCSNKNSVTTGKCGVKKSVCAFFLDSRKNLLSTTVSAARTACKDQAVQYYTKGKCQKLEKDKNTYCLPNNRPNSCSKRYDPVCGFYGSEIDGNLISIKTNACTACQDPKVIYHQPGPCVFQCERAEFVIFECDGSYVNPICGTYTQDSQVYHVSIKNDCSGCYDFLPQIDSYTYGLCPGDIGIRCDTDAVSFGKGSISPICGLAVEGCTDSSCRLTLAEPLVSCDFLKNVLYIPGACPGDRGISCEPYRPNAENNLCNSDTWLLYEGICGYTNKECNDNTCRKTFENQCDACADASIMFFEADACPNS